MPMNADDLRQVAKQMRDYADAVTTGDGPTLSRYWMVDEEVEGLCWNVIAEDEGSFILEGLTDPAIARHVAAWDPAIAHFIAGWLSEEAAELAIAKGNEFVIRHRHRFAIAVAKAWRGES